MNKNKKIKLDKETGALVRVEETIVNPGSQSARVTISGLKLELVQIVEQVKELKARADEIKEMITLLEGEKEKEPEGPSVIPAQFPVQ